MDLEGRKNNTYFDKKGKQILVGDLLKVFRFRSRNRNYYMYQAVVMEDTMPFPVMACKAYYADKPHYRLFQVCDNGQRVYFDAEIIAYKDVDTNSNRLKIKL